MEYDLIKQLEDAGFPFKGEERYEPSLKELIVACTSTQGGNFALHQNFRTDDRQWCAWLINSNAQNPTAYDFKEYSSTSEEAVGKLWLALNRREDHAV